jgi:hypothetical protein
VAVLLHNGKRSFVVGGQPESVAGFGSFVHDWVYKSPNVNCVLRVLPVTVPFHSEHYLSSVVPTMTEVFDKLESEGMKVRFDGQQLRIPVYSFVDGEDLRNSDTTVQGHLFLRLVSDIAEMPLHWDTVIAAAFDPTNNGHINGHINGHTNGHTNGTDGSSAVSHGHQRTSSSAPSPLPAATTSFFIADFGPGFYVQALSRHSIEEQFGKDQRMNVEIIDLSLSNEVQFLTPGLSRDCKWTANEKLQRNSNMMMLCRTGSGTMLAGMSSPSSSSTASSASSSASADTSPSSASSSSSVGANAGEKLQQQDQQQHHRRIGGETVVQFINVRVLRRHQLLREDVWIAGGKVIDPEAYSWELTRRFRKPCAIVADTVVDGKGMILAPGFIDIQVNGGFGIDFSSSTTMTPLLLQQFAQRVLAHGCTSFCPTVVSSSAAAYRKLMPVFTTAAAAAAKAKSANDVGRNNGAMVDSVAGEVLGVGVGAEVLKLHLEGPFINLDKKGAHNPSVITAPSPDAGGAGDEGDADAGNADENEGGAQIKTDGDGGGAEGLAQIAREEGALQAVLDRYSDGIVMV